MTGVCHTIHCGIAATQLQTYPMFCGRCVSCHPLWQCGHTGKNTCPMFCDRCVSCHPLWQCGHTGKNTCPMFCDRCVSCHPLWQCGHRTLLYGKPAGARGHDLPPCAATPPQPQQPVSLSVCLSAQLSYCLSF